MERKSRVLLAGPMSPPTIGGIRALLTTLRSSRLSELVRLDTFDIGEVPGTYVERRFGPRRLLRLMRQLLAFISEVNRVRPQVIHIHTPGGLGLVKGSLFLLLSRWQRIPTVIHLHFWPDRLHVLKMRWTGKVMIKVLGQADSIISVSEEMASYLRKHLPTHKRIDVFHNCINLAEWSKLKRTTHLNNGVQLLFLGDIVGNRKGILDLIEAFARIKTSCRDRLVVVGSDRRTGDLKRAQSLACSLGLADRCQFLGPIYGEEKLQIIVNSDVFVLPSHAEGQPISILEAMAAGLPIIASRVGAIPDVIRDGENGILVDPGDIHGLSMAIERLIRSASLRKSLGKRSRRLAHEYDVDPYLERLIFLYEGVALSN